jgi:glycosyltransferase involved in cell wall biosynthesis
MLPSDQIRVGFVVKRYPRYSETFIVREILAHEQAGLAIEIFALRPPIDGHFQDLIARVRAPVNYLYLPAEGLFPEPLSAATLTANHFWRALKEASEVVPNLWASLGALRHPQARDVYQALQLAREVRVKRIDHLHAPFASDAATVARLGARLAGVSYSFTARAKDIFHESVRPEHLRQKLRDASGVVTVSDYHLDYLRQTYGPLASHVQRIYNGLDLDEFPYEAPRDRPRKIVAIGRLVEKKGFSDLIDACALLVSRGCSFSCRIIGNGPLKADLSAQVERLALQGHVSLVGPRPQREVIEEVQTAAVLAAPCIVCEDGDRDGLPNVIQEALALGTPVISTDVTGIPEVVRDEETGLLVPQHDPPALAAALERLLSDAALRVELSTRARHFMEAEFNIHRNTARRRALFQAAVEGQRDKGAEIQEVDEFRNRGVSSLSPALEGA